MQVSILGPLEVRGDDGAPIAVTGARLRVLLTRLALDAGRPVGVPLLIDAVWGERPPGERGGDSANALQTLVSRLRRALGGASLVAQSAAGYRLMVEPSDVDAHRFATLAANGATAMRDGEFDRAVPIFDEALGLWRGPALAEGGEAVAADAIRLHDRREAVRLDRAEALLALGRGPALVTELEVSAAERPLDERLAGQLMRALAQAGRQADALEHYERVRSRLAEDLGVDPSSELQAAHLAVLRGELHAEPPARPESADAPPPARRTNLRAQLTSFVGRDREVARIAASLDTHRLVTLVGPGGAGKTRLAAEAAASILDGVPDGGWLVELAPVSDPAALPQTVLDSLGLREAHLLERRIQTSTADAETRLLDTLGDKDLLLILDNCEHLVDGCAKLADELLAHCPRLRVLATSREPLGITGEVLLAVPPLGQPATGATPAEALQFPAVRLFADRAATVAPELVLDDEVLPAVVDVVCRLDGLPLAIELAAARLRTMSLTEIADRLSDRFRLLTGGSRTAMPRHRTLRAVVEWSWDLLTPAERLLAERLAILPAGANAESATAVCAGDGGPDGMGGMVIAAEDVPELLASLVDKSLLQPVDDGGTAPSRGRVRMLETIREYGLERLDERGELTELRRRHAAYFAQLIDEAQPQLISAEQLPWFALLRAERDNITAAIRFRATTGDVDGARQMAVTLAGMAMLLGNHAEVPVLLADARNAQGGRDERLYWLTETLYTMNSVMGTGPASTSEDVAEAMARMAQLREHLDLLDVGWHPLVGLLKVAIAYFAGDVERSEHYIAEALDTGSSWTVASILMFRGSLAENNGDAAGMRADSLAALEKFRAIGERWGTASALRTIALVHTYDGDLDAAEAAYAEALQLMSELNSRDDEAFLRIRLAELRMRRGDLAGAREQARRAQLASEYTGSGVESLFVLGVRSVVEWEAGNTEEAQRLRQLAQQRADQLPAAAPIGGHAVAVTRVMSANFAMRDGDLDDAYRRLTEAYPIALETEDMPIIASFAVSLAEYVQRCGDARTSARLLGAAAELRGADDPTGVDIARVTARLREQLGERFDDEYAAGKGLGRDRALALIDPGRSAAAPVPAHR